MFDRRVSYPAATIAGKLISDPPPATAFTAPATNAAPARAGRTSASTRLKADAPCAYTPLPYDAQVASHPIVTFDLDGVICRPPFGINPGRNQGKPRDGAGKRNLLWATERWRYAGRRPMPGARDGFRAIAERFECHVLSARAEVARGGVERWFGRYIGVVPVMHLRPTWEEKPAQFKARIVGELAPLAHFEDDPHTAQWLAELVPAVFLVDWPRNNWLTGPNVHRVRMIGEALPLLDRLAAGDSIAERTDRAPRVE